LTELDNILPKVTRPARYTGGEWNAVAKDWDKTRLKIALAYPDSYEIGMSNMAVPILYELFNSQPDVLAERVYAPWVDMAAAMQQAGIPLFSLESQRPLCEFDMVGFSLGYELTYTNVLNMLHLAQIPVLAAERDDSCPLVIAGGSATLNPEPMTDFIDFFVIGDGEEVVLELLDVLRGWRKGLSKKRLLRKVAAIPGVYVPSLYNVEYHGDGLVKGITPVVSGVRPTIQRRIAAKLPPPPVRPVVPYIEVVHDRAAVEIQRGCSCGCRFCQAGIIYRPVRERPKEEVLNAVGDIIANCGYDEVSLVSLSTSDYPGIDDLVAELAQRYPNLAISLPSLRSNAHSVSLVDSLSSRRKTGLTFAPEAGSQRLRDVINKNITEDEIMAAANTAFDCGWTSLKLYFMVGLPTETMDDVNGIVHLVSKIYALSRQTKGRRPQLRVSVATFVPKPHTPFQWVAQDSEATLSEKNELLQSGLRQRGIKLSWQDTKISLLEAALSRGDRRLGRVIHRAWQLGAVFDAWNEHFKYDYWRRAFTETGLDAGFYAHRERAVDEVLPWSHIDIGVAPAFLKQEYQCALQDKSTPDCRYYGCVACGLEKLEVSCPQRLSGKPG
jgi:radical SAM family uncharacterized protein